MLRASQAQGEAAAGGWIYGLTYPTAGEEVHSPLPTPHSPESREWGVGSGETQEGQNTTLVSLFFRIKTPSIMLVTTMIPLSK